MVTPEWAERQSDALPHHADPRKPDRLLRARRFVVPEEESWAREKEPSRAAWRAELLSAKSLSTESWSRGILLRADPFSLLDRVNLIHAKIAKTLYQPARPGDFDAIDLGVDSQAEVQPKVVLRKVAAASTNFIELHEFPSMNRQARTDRGAVTLCALQMKFNPVISIGEMIA